MTGILTIGKLAKAAGAKVETVRWYEQVGMIETPARTGGNYRVYGQDALAQLSFIRRARDLGFPLEQVRALLNLAAKKIAIVGRSTSSRASILLRSTARSRICRRCAKNWRR